MLDALLATGTVQLQDEGQTIRLTQTSYQPLAGSEDQITYLARNLGDHMSAASENVQGHTPPHFERAVHYSGLTEAQIATLDARFREGEMALLQEIGQTAAAMQRDTTPPGPYRLRAGGYFYHTKDAD